MEVSFIKIKGVRDYIDVIYNDVKNSDKYKIQVAYNGKDIKKVVEYFYQIEEENKQLKDKIKELENVIVTDEFHFARPHLLTFKSEILKTKIDKTIETLESFIGCSITDDDKRKIINDLKGSDK